MNKEIFENKEALFRKIIEKEEIAKQEKLEQLENLECIVIRENEIITNDKVYIKVNGEVFGVPKNKMKKYRLTSDNTFPKFEIIKQIRIDEKRYFLYSNKAGSLYFTNNINSYYKVTQKLNTFITKKYVYFFGTIKNVLYKDKKFENVYIDKEQVTIIKRISKLKVLKHISIFRISIEKLKQTGEIHNKLRIGSFFETSIPVTMRIKETGMHYFAKKKVGDNYILVRTVTDGNSAVITNIKFEKEYKKSMLFKNFCARVISKVIKQKDIILMFEKESNKANESGYYMFTKIMEENKKNKLRSKVFFILNRESSDYEKVKKEYPNNVIDKYSLKHYVYIYISKYFVSSELSNHVLNPRLYIKTLNNVITKKPLIFLQHGIMFAKPIDNPAAKGFYKDKTGLNIYKNIISSDLEAEQFYKAGYSAEDLIKCGLTKFDISKINKDADKITYMLTYRYWEEALTFEEKSIEETTYFKKYVEVIELFAKNKMLDKLVIASHPKFFKALESTINKKYPKYVGMIEKDINKAIENSKIFITDYSSASYDAHYRGAYIIYDWSEREYLIENYQAIPPINEENCDGVPTYSVEQLVEEVKNAIEKDYKMDDIYQERYKKINEFSDNKNGDRLIVELKRIEVI